MYSTINDVCERALAMPCSPALLPRLHAVLRRDDANMEDLEEVIRIDSVLTGATLRLANSAFFGGGSGEVSSLSEALMRLGLREVYRLAALSLAGRWMNTNNAGYGWEPSDFFRSSVVTAVAGEILAEKSGRVDPGEAYTAGLICEIGKIAIAHACGDAFEEIRAYQSAQQCPWLHAETAVLGYNHSVVTAHLLKEWNFPASFVAVAEFNPPRPDMESAHLPLAVHVHGARYLAASFGVGQGEDGFLFELQDGLLSEWGLDADILSAALPCVLDRAGRLLQDKLANGEIKF